MTKTLSMYTFMIGMFIHSIVAAEPFLDKYVKAGMNDPHSLAVCRITGVTHNGKQSVATGSLVKINGHIVVVTVAHMLKPTTVEFFKSFSENPPTLSTSLHHVKSKKSLWEGSNGPETADLQVLFLDQNPEGVTPLELATTSDLTNSLKIIGYGSYYIEREENVSGVRVYESCRPVRTNLSPALTKAKLGSKLFGTKTQYDPTKLETHTFGGFSGAPVINYLGKVVSIITQATRSHIEERKPLEVQRRSNLIAAIGLISTYAFDKWPENRFIRLALGGVTVGTIAGPLYQYFSTKKYECFHLNLQHPSVQSWLNEAVPAE